MIFRRGRAPGIGVLKKEQRGRDSKPQYVLHFTDARGVRRRLALSTDKVVAQRKQIEVIRARDLELAGLGGEVGQERALVDIAKLYVADLRTRASDHHVTNVASNLRRTLEQLRAKRVRDLVPHDLMQHRAKLLESGLAVRSVNLRVATVRAMLGWALQAGLIAENPIAKLRPLPESEATQRCRRRALTEAEIERLLQAARDDDARQAQGLFPDAGEFARPGLRKRVPQAPLLRACVETGARYGELVATTWSDLDFDRAMLLLRAANTKAKRERQIPLRAVLVEELRALRPPHVAVLGRPLRPSDRIFLTPEGCAWPRHTVNAIRLLDRILEIAGIDRVDAQGRKVDWHALRHAAATRFARAKVPLIMTQKILGHSDPKLTARIYSHLDAEDLRDAVERLGQQDPTQRARDVLDQRESA